MEMVLVDLLVAAIADADAGVYADVDDGAILDVGTATVAHQLDQIDLKICYLVHDEEDLLDQLDNNNEKSNEC